MSLVLVKDHVIFAECSLFASSWI